MVGAGERGRLPVVATNTGAAMPTHVKEGPYRVGCAAHDDQRLAKQLADNVTARLRHLARVSDQIPLPCEPRLALILEQLLIRIEELLEGPARLISV